jgi:hypothetical protein
VHKAHHRHDQGINDVVDLILLVIDSPPPSSTPPFYVYQHQPIIILMGIPNQNDLLLRLLLPDDHHHIHVLLPLFLLLFHAAIHLILTAVGISRYVLTINSTATQLYVDPIPTLQHQHSH